MKITITTLLIAVCVIVMSIVPINALEMSDTASATASGGGCSYYSCLSTNSSWIVFSTYASCSGSPEPDEYNDCYVDVWMVVSANGNSDSGGFRYPDEDSSDFVSVGTGGVTANSASGNNTFMYNYASVSTYITWSDGVFVVHDV